VTERRVVVLGSLSGRNAGDTALARVLIDDLSVSLPGCRFSIATIDPDRVGAELGENPRVELVNTHPRRGGLKLWSLPLLKRLRRADLVVVTGNPLFDRKLWNPVSNYLLPLSLLLPYAKRRGAKLVLYNVSLGPVQTPTGRRLIQRALGACDAVHVRDQRSAELAERLGAGPKPVVTADSALRLQGPPTASVDAELERLGLGDGRPMLGVSVNAYLDAFMAEGFHQTREVNAVVGRLAEAVDGLAAAVGGRLVFFVSQDMDLAMTRRVVAKVRTPSPVVVSNRELGMSGLAGLLGRCDLVTGMRTHALILAASESVPVVGLLSYDKTAGFMESLGLGQWVVSFKQVLEGRYEPVLRRAWASRAATREHLDAVLPAMRARAGYTADVAAALVQGERVPALPGETEPETSARVRTLPVEVPKPRGSRRAEKASRQVA
jgi:polysaccharide pyruvyl transferase WcaK-like protein